MSLSCQLLISFYAFYLSLCLLLTLLSLHLLILYTPYFYYRRPAWWKDFLLVACHCIVNVLFWYCHNIVLANKLACLLVNYDIIVSCTSSPDGGNVVVLFNLFLMYFVHESCAIYFSMNVFVADSDLFAIASNKSVLETFIRDNLRVINLCLRHLFVII